jgi:hypothetical protein
MAASNDRAPEALLARACRDAIEHSVTPLRLDIPQQHPVLELIAAAGGKVLPRETDSGEASLAKVLDLAPLARATLVSKPDVRLTLELREEPPTLPLQRGGTGDVQRFVIDEGRLLSDRSPARPQVVCSASTLLQLLVGHCSVEQASGAQQLRCSSKAAREALEQVLSPRPLWFAPLEDLLA